MSITNRIKQGPVELDYEESALVVHYEVETVQVNERGAILDIIDRKPEVRRIKIKSLSPDKNMAQLSNDIVDKCKYIHPSRAEEIEQLLIKLRKFHLNNQGSGSSTPNPNSNANPSPTPDSNNNDKNINDYQPNKASRSKPEKPKPRAIDLLPPADMNEIDDYLEMLYQVSGKSEREKEEGLRMQEKGTAMILKLCLDVMNLESLIQNSTVMGALTRVLQEEFKKSIDLTFNILRIFLSFSNFIEMHSLMANYRIGVLTMKAIEFEIKRSEMRENEKFEREKDYESELSKHKDDLLEYPRILEKVRKLREKDAIKESQFVKKQDKLLYVGFYILINLAEDINVEKKMIKKNLIQMLLSMLTHSSFSDLLVLTLTFLKKLTIYEENKNSLKDLNIIDSLTKLLSCNSPAIVISTLRLLFNLSFDKDLREQMLKAGYIPKLIQLLKTSQYRAKTLRLLYHLSVDDRCKSMISSTDGITTLMGMIINFPQDMLPKELAALMINLSYFGRNVEIMISNKGLNLLMDRFQDKRDPLLMKIIRNISLWSFNHQLDLESPEMNYKYRGLWSPHIKPLLEILMEKTSDDLTIEIVGCLGNMTVYDLPSTSNWSKLLRDYNLMNYFRKLLTPGMAQNDLILEIIIFISSIATDPQACGILATGNLITTLYDLFKEKSEDTEIVLQLLNCFHKLLFTESSREAAMYNTRIFSDIIECLGHRNGAIRAQAEKMSELVLEYDRKQSGEIGQLGQQVLRKRFESYNKVWVANANLNANYYDDDQHEADDGSVQGEWGHYANLDYSGKERMPTSYEQQMGIANSERYFNDRVTNSMDSKAFDPSDYDHYDANNTSMMGVADDHMDSWNNSNQYNSYGHK